MHPLRLAALSLWGSFILVTGHPRTAVAQPVVSSDGTSITITNTSGVEVYVAAGRCGCAANLDGSVPIAIEPVDMAIYSNQWTADLQGGGVWSDMDDDGQITPADHAAYTNLWAAKCVQTQAWMDGTVQTPPCTSPVSVVIGTVSEAGWKRTKVAPTRPRYFHTIVLPNSAGKVVLSQALSAELVAHGSIRSAGVYQTVDIRVNLASSPADYPDVPLGAGATDTAHPWR